MSDADSDVVVCEAPALPPQGTEPISDAAVTELCRRTFTQDRRAARKVLEEHGGNRDLAVAALRRASSATKEPPSPPREAAVGSPRRASVAVPTKDDGAARLKRLVASVTWLRRASGVAAEPQIFYTVGPVPDEINLGDFFPPSGARDTEIKAAEECRALLNSVFGKVIAGGEWGYRCSGCGSPFSATFSPLPRSPPAPGGLCVSCESEFLRHPGAAVAASLRPEDLQQLPPWEAFDALSFGNFPKSVDASTFARLYVSANGGYLGFHEKRCLPAELPKFKHQIFDGRCWCGFFFVAFPLASSNFARSIVRLANCPASNLIRDRSLLKGFLAVLSGPRREWVPCQECLNQRAYSFPFSSVTKFSQSPDETWYCLTCFHKGLPSKQTKSRVVVRYCDPTLATQWPALHFGVGKPSRTSTKSLVVSLSVAFCWRASEAHRPCIKRCASRPACRQQRQRLSAGRVFAPWWPRCGRPRLPSQRRT